MKITETKIIKKIKKRQLKIIWFNLPFSKILKRNIGMKFFKLINRHFLEHHKMSKIFNRNTITLSYKCCRNIGSVIASHNQRVVLPTSINYERNCRNRAKCQHHIHDKHYIRNSGINTQ